MNPSTPARVTLIIPCFNASATLASTVESAIASMPAREASSAEIVVVDDGSTDSSLEIARRFEPRVKVLTGPNQGVSAARNRGIAESNGEWIVFLDSDDLLKPGTIEERLAVAENADVVCCAWQELIEAGGKETNARIHLIDRALLERDAEVATAVCFWAPPAAIMYRRSLVERIGGFRPDFPIIQDARFLFDAAIAGGRFAVSDHLGARYRIRPDSLSRRDPLQFWREVLLNGTQIEALWRARGELTPAQRQALADIYDQAARGFFAAADGSYFDAVERLKSMRLRLSKHSRVAFPLARAVGLRGAQKLLEIFGP